ncbi:hypothetical protein DXG03_003577 [Asterophora parasitica]|uniref:Zn(2)-C6 fungal-type domain-containing protein n=1 Tax=Asterophora parasitica TaxID=117018 RepID=A0A9P7G7I9_9AGAR|nr:hypothetical protein DXG03_003577 [Asterophora parasitica]
MDVFHDDASYLDWQSQAAHQSQSQAAHQSQSQSHHPPQPPPPLHQLYALPPQSWPDFAGTPDQFHQFHPPAPPPDPAPLPYSSFHSQTAPHFTPLDRPSGTSILRPPLILDRHTLAGTLDPATNIFYRSPEHPRLRTAQACEKCRTRKAKCSGEHPTCKRCITRGLVCEYAKEGRVRGPNKPKPKPTITPGSASASGSTHKSKEEARHKRSPSTSTPKHEGDDLLIPPAVSAASSSFDSLDHESGPSNSPSRHRRRNSERPRPRPQPLRLDSSNNTSASQFRVIQGPRSSEFLSMSQTFDVDARSSGEERSHSESGSGASNPPSAVSSTFDPAIHSSSPYAGAGGDHPIPNSSHGTISHSQEHNHNVHDNNHIHDHNTHIHDLIHTYTNNPPRHHAIPDLQYPQHPVSQPYDPLPSATHTQQQPPSHSEPGMHQDFIAGPAQQGLFDHYRHDGSDFAATAESSDSSSLVTLGVPRWSSERHTLVHSHSQPHLHARRPDYEQTQQQQAGPFSVGGMGMPGTMDMDMSGDMGLGTNGIGGVGVGHGGNAVDVRGIPHEGWTG